MMNNFSSAYNISTYLASALFASQPLSAFMFTYLQQNDIEQQKLDNFYYPYLMHGIISLHFNSLKFTNVKALNVSGSTNTLMWHRSIFLFCSVHLQTTYRVVSRH